MKQYCHYTSSSNKLRWKFFKGFKYPSMKAIEKDNYADRGDIHIAYVGFCSKAAFVRIVSDADQSSKNWVKERVSRTGNEKNIKVCDENPGYIIVYLYSRTIDFEKDTILEKIKIIK